MSVAIATKGLFIPVHGSMTKGGIPREQEEVRPKVEVLNISFDNRKKKTGISEMITVGKIKVE